MISKKCIVFKYKGKFAHFLKAEANASAPSYPFPSRTILMGLVGAVLGLPKDLPQIELNDANFAVAGRSQSTHWHTANLRKDPPALLPLTIKKNDKGTSKDQRNTMISQEWLYKPNFTIFTQLPENYHDQFEHRIKNRQWHFTPCLGLSEMMADLEFIDSAEIRKLKSGTYGIVTPIRKKFAEIDMNAVLESESVMKSIRMPRHLTQSREFVHEDYIYEARGEQLFIKTENAFEIGNRIISWL